MAATAPDGLDLRCSPQARAGGTEPLGTAAAADAFLLVEVPLPWPADVADHAALAGVPEVAAGLGARLQAVVPATPPVPGGPTLAQVVLHRRPPGPFRRYERREVVVPLADLVAGCAAVADADVAAGGDGEVLVCTHGSRDRCCGALGTSLFQDVVRRPGRRIRRTSHTGGHRFAPTAVVLPEGTVWAWLDDALLDVVLARSGDVATVLPHYRGSTALPSPTLQVAEAAVFARVGWPWLDASRSVAVVDTADAGAEVRVESDLGNWRAVVRQVGTRPQPACGVPPGEGGKLDAVWRLVELAEER
jgi:hypothetical protein